MPFSFHTFHHLHHNCNESLSFFISCLSCSTTGFMRTKDYVIFLFLYLQILTYNLVQSKSLIYTCLHVWLDSSFPVQQLSVAIKKYFEPNEMDARIHLWLLASYLPYLCPGCCLSSFHSSPPARCQQSISWHSHPLNLHQSWQEGSLQVRVHSGVAEQSLSCKADGC